MSGLREAAQAALDALDKPVEHGAFVGWMVGVQRAAAALRVALAEPGPKLFTLSDRLRPGVECAAWVIDDVRRLESAHAHQYAMAGQMLREAERAGRERDEAVAALRSIVETISLGMHPVHVEQAIGRARAVLAKIEGEQA